MRRASVSGTLAVRIARALSGKNKPTWTPHIDDGDHVIVINAEKIELGGKKWTQKLYYRHSNYPGGLKVQTAREIADKYPERLIEKAVRGMLPTNRMRDAQLRRLNVYAGESHPHDAQKPAPLLSVLVGAIWKKRRRHSIDRAPKARGREREALARTGRHHGQRQTGRRIFSASPTHADRASAARSDADWSRFDVRVKAEGGGVTDKPARSVTASRARCSRSTNRSRKRCARTASSRAIRAKRNRRSTVASAPVSDSSTANAKAASSSSSAIALGAIALARSTASDVDRKRLRQRSLSALGARRVCDHTSVAMVARRPRRRSSAIAAIVWQIVIFVRLRRANRCRPWSAAAQLRGDPRPLRDVVRAELGMELRARADRDARARSMPRA